MQSTKLTNTWLAVISILAECVYLTYSQARTVITEAITESCSSYSRIWICEKKSLLRSFKVVSKWNSLPADVVNACTEC